MDNLHQTLLNQSILDNPAWHALKTKHKDHAIGTNVIQRYPLGMLRMLACQDPALAKLDEIEPWVKAGEKLVVIGALPKLPPNWAIHAKLDCLQMVGPTKKLPVKNPDVITLMTLKEKNEMLALINLVQPGFFYSDTPLLGNYFGVIKSGRLVAMAGERLCMSEFTEISAVCTHPSFRGEGFASDLITRIVNKNLDNQIIPFLHVVSSNSTAIKIYEHLGFRARKMIPFWELAFTGG